MAVFVIMDVAVIEANSLTIVTLTQCAATATSETQRAAYMTAANYSPSRDPLWLCGFFDRSFHRQYLMPKGANGKLATYLRIVTGIAGIVADFSVFLPALTVIMLLSLLTFSLWRMLAGLRLYQFGKQQSGEETATVTTI